MAVVSATAYSNTNLVKLSMRTRTHGRSLHLRTYGPKWSAWTTSNGLEPGSIGLQCTRFLSRLSLFINALQTLWKPFAETNNFAATTQLFDQQQNVPIGHENVHTKDLRIALGTTNKFQSDSRSVRYKILLRKVKSAISAGTVGLFCMCVIFVFYLLVS